MRRLFVVTAAACFLCGAVAQMQTEGTKGQKSGTTSNSWKCSPTAPGHAIPPLTELVELHERLALPARPARVAAVALNTRRLDEDEARRAVEAAEEETGLVADDPVRFGPGRLVDAVHALAQSGIRRS